MDSRDEGGVEGLQSVGFEHLKEQARLITVK